MLQLSTRMDGDVLVVACNGKIVYGDEAAHLRQQVKQFLAQSHFIVLDLEQVTMLDSNGVGTLVSLAASARNVGGDVRLAGMTQRLKDVLRITKLTPLFAIYEKVAEGVDSFHRENTPLAVNELAG